MYFTITTTPSAGIQFHLILRSINTRDVPGELIRRLEAEDDLLPGKYA
jgi:hypothetical protein